MSRRLEHIDGCGCTMCRQIEQYRVGDADWACRVDCSCPKCNVVRALADQREAAKACACGCGGSCGKPPISGADVGGAIGETVCGPICGLAGRVIGSLFD